jgi:hypothetical protein
MTFILNVLHHNYSLLAADWQGNTDGPTTITIGNVTINAPKGTRIEGFRKVKISKCGTVAVGVAGNTMEHKYFNNFESADGIDSALKSILDSIRDFLLSPDRSQNFSKPTMMQNEGIASFFDLTTSRYFSLLYLYTHLHAHSHWYQVASGSAMLLHVGSGSSEFETAVGLDEINGFVASLKVSSDPQACMDWIKDAYEKVSLVAKGVGKKPEFFLSTRSEKSFRVWE